MSLTLVMITDSERPDDLERCLESFKGKVDDYVVVFTQPNFERHLEITLKYTTNWHSFVWCDDFSAARNYATSFVKTTHWIWADSDDTFENNMPEYSDFDIVFMNYNYSQDEQGVSTCMLTRERILRTTCNFKWEGKIHESININGDYKRLVTDCVIKHNRKHSSSERNLKILEKAVLEDPSPRNLLYYGNELKYIAGRNKDAILAYEKFLYTGGVWYEDTACCYQYLAECYLKDKNEAKFQENIFRSLLVEPRRNDPYCIMGDYCLAKNEYKNAIHWYSLAMKIKRPAELLSVFQPQNATWYPAMQSSLAYNSLGDVKNAMKMNEMFLGFKPNNVIGLKNKQIFLDFLEGKTETDKKLKVCWICQKNEEAAQSRIRVLNVSKWLSSKGVENEIISEYRDSYDVYIVGKSFSEYDFNEISKLRKAGKYILCDLCESLFEFKWFIEIIEIVDKVICCSYKLAEKVSVFNPNTVVIEDAVEV